MTYAPASLRLLQALWGAHGVNLGVVGDVAHQVRGVSYHLGRSQLSKGAYSIQTARDKHGLTEAASAIDLGKLDGSYTKLRDFSRWLVAQSQAHKPGTSDIREIIYSDRDGKTVLRYDRERGYGSTPRPGEADTSHLWHTHVSFYRDSETRDRTKAFRPYFGAPDLPDTDTAPEAPVGVIEHTPKGTIRSGIFRASRDAITYPLDRDPTRGQMAAGATRHGLGLFGLDGLQGREVVLVWEDGEVAFVATADGTWTETGGVDFNAGVEAAAALALKAKR